MYRVGKLEQFLIDETFPRSKNLVTEMIVSRNEKGKLKIDEEKKRKRKNLQGGEMDGKGNKRRLDLIALSAVAT